MVFDKESINIGPNAKILVNVNHFSRLPDKQNTMEEDLIDIFPLIAGG